MQPKALPGWENSSGVDFNRSIGHGDKQEGDKECVKPFLCSHHLLKALGVNRYCGCFNLHSQCDVPWLITSFLLTENPFSISAGVVISVEWGEDILWMDLNQTLALGFLTTALCLIQPLWIRFPGDFPCLCGTVGSAGRWAQSCPSPCGIPTPGAEPPTPNSFHSAPSRSCWSCESQTEPCSAGASWPGMEVVLVT